MRGKSPTTCFILFPIIDRCSTSNVCSQSCLASSWVVYALSSRHRECFVEQANLEDDASAKTKAFKAKKPQRPLLFRDFPAVPPPPEKEPADDGRDHQVNGPVVSILDALGY